MLAPLLTKPAVDLLLNCLTSKVDIIIYLEVSISLVPCTRGRGGGIYIDNVWDNIFFLSFDEINDFYLPLFYYCLMTSAVGTFLSLGVNN